MVLIDPTTALVCLTLLGAIVVVLNAISLIVAVGIKNSSQNKKNYPLFWLLAANVLIGLFPLPVYGLKKYSFSSISISSKICDAWRYTYFLTIHLALISLIVLTVEKVIHLSFPLRHMSIINNKRLNATLVFFWMFFIIFDMIPFFPFNEHDDEHCHYVVKKKWAVTMNIITMAIPLPVITVTYMYIVWIAYKQAVRIRSTSTDRKTRRPSAYDNIKLAVEVKATRKVVYIVGSYILCWMPSTLYYLLEWLCPSCYPANYQPHKTWIRFFFKLLVLFHAFLTPILFCWQSVGFRGDAKRLFLRLKHSPSNSVDCNSNNATMLESTSAKEQKRKMGIDNLQCSEINTIHAQVNLSPLDKKCVTFKVR